MSTQIDVLVAEHVMGLKPCSDPAGRCDLAHMVPPQCWGTGAGGSQLESYSEWIPAAWQVVEHMELSRPNKFMLWTEHGQWGAEFDNDFGRFAATAPLAICLAALAVLGVEVPTE